MSALSPACLANWPRRLYTGVNQERHRQLEDNQREGDRPCHGVVARENDNQTLQDVVDNIRIPRKKALRRGYDFEDRPSLPVVHGGLEPVWKPQRMTLSPKLPPIALKSSRTSQFVETGIDEVRSGPIRRKEWR
jgi:hypothetical protein